MRLLDIAFNHKQHLKAKNYTETLQHFTPLQLRGQSVLKIAVYTKKHTHKQNICLNWILATQEPDMLENVDGSGIQGDGFKVGVLIHMLHEYLNNTRS